MTEFFLTSMATTMHNEKEYTILSINILLMVKNTFGIKGMVPNIKIDINYQYRNVLLICNLC